MHFLSFPRGCRARNPDSSPPRSKIDRLVQGEESVEEPNSQICAGSSRLRKKAFRTLLSLSVISPPRETVDFLAGAFCHPDQVSEAQAGANAWRDQREAMCLKTRGKEEIASR